MGKGLKEINYFSFMQQQKKKKKNCGNFHKRNPHLYAFRLRQKICRQHVVKR